MVRIVGACDPFYRETNILVEDTIVIPEVGHYPFFEDAHSFAQVFTAAIKLIQQQL